MAAHRPLSSVPASRPNVGGNVCPACGHKVLADAKWCDSCHFTGARTMDMFPDSPPPLLPVLDAAAVWNTAEIQEIEEARRKLLKIFPQFRVNVWSVDLPPDTALPVFGFWLINACPLDKEESAEDRAWTVLLLINAGTGQAAAIPGYSAERILTDSDWKKILTSMAVEWKSGQRGAAVISFFENCAGFLNDAWNTHSRHRTKRPKS
jgi:hypothetical protein